jgi:hypothetical protein
LFLEVPVIILLSLAIVVLGLTIGILVGRRQVKAELQAWQEGFENGFAKGKGTSCHLVVMGV